MIRFSLPFQKSHILVKQILHCLCTPPCPKPCQRCMIRHRLFFQKPHEVHTVPAGLLQLSTGIDPALVSVRHYLEQHSWVDLRFSAFGRIGACSPVPQAGRLSVGRVRSLATKFRCSMQRPVDHFSHLRYTGFAFGFFSQTNHKAKRRAGNPFFSGRPAHLFYSASVRYFATRPFISPAEGGGEAVNAPDQ